MKPMADKPQHPPTIELDKARLRPLRVADAAALYAYLRDPAVTELTSYPVASVPMVEAMIERSRSRWAAGELSRWGIVLQDDDQLVGTCGFNEWSRVHRWAELAFDLAQAHWGKGADAPSRGRGTSVDFPTGPGRSGARLRQGGQQALGALARAQWVCA